MKNRNQELIKHPSGISIVVSRSKDGEFFAWAKLGKIETFCPVKESGDIWFVFEKTRELAISSVLSELLN
jgi:esterase/lipase superfamily enzyme